MSYSGTKPDSKGMDLELAIGGKEITLVHFAHNSFRDIIVAFTNNLKGHEGGKIEITIDQ